ncbi:hypothetical protein ALO92_101443 [Pseudomonas congelans]|uniref:Uncharacterized protein n=1 Tax=Pseudomonas congelans TaxID=200452 RepID=A0A0P9M5E6_9PSED|nr:hypothetical protein ALO92_101443 [Pseudomonas congelans]
MIVSPHAACSSLHTSAFDSAWRPWERAGRRFACSRRVGMVVENASTDAPSSRAGSLPQDSCIAMSAQRAYRANAPRLHALGDATRHKSAALRGIQRIGVSGFAAACISGRIE